MHGKLEFKPLICFSPQVTTVTNTLCSSLRVVTQMFSQKQKSGVCALMIFDFLTAKRKGKNIL